MSIYYSVSLSIINILLKKFILYCYQPFIAVNLLCCVAINYLYFLNIYFCISINYLQLLIYCAVFLSTIYNCNRLFSIVINYLYPVNIIFCIAINYLYTVNILFCISVNFCIHSVNNLIYCSVLILLSGEDVSLALLRWIYTDQNTLRELWEPRTNWEYDIL